MHRLLVPGIFVYAIILFRAAHQAVTLDEADGFLNFATGNLDMSFYPSSGNHVLHSLLARFSTQVFGVSQFTFRIPAMIGAALYLFAVASITRRIAPIKQLLGFAILTLNPFILDYLVASRGYALALGLLALAVALGMVVVEDCPTLRMALLTSAILSVCCGLAIAANFSFAFCIVSTVAALVVAVKLAGGRWLSIAAAATLPGLAVGYAIVGQTIQNYPRSQLYYGAQTWAEMWTEMLDAVYPRQNLSLQMVDIQALLIGARHAAAFLVLIPLVIGLWAGLSTKSWPMRFIWLSLTLTLTAHGLAHAFQGLLLPLDRTSLFIAFFLSLIAVHAASAAPVAMGRGASAAILWASLIVFALAFRTNYFRIWDFDMDIDRGFAAYTQYAREHPVESVGCTWRYGGAYNFYLLASGASVPKCDYIDQDNPPPRSAYFVHTPGQDAFGLNAQFSVIYQGPQSGLLIWIRQGDSLGSRTHQGHLRLVRPESATIKAAAFYIQTDQGMVYPTRSSRKSALAYTSPPFSAH